jgi:rhodanese-related sulfurtransferase
MFGIFKNIFSKTDTTQMKDIISKGAFLVDVRTPAEFSEGHVNGSVNIPLDQVQNQLAKFKNKENIVVFCRSGNRSSQAKSILEQNGFTNVTNGGTWQDVNQIINQ